MKALVKKKEKDGSVFYLIQWSSITKADKYDIVRKIPSIPGIYELYYMDEKKKLNLFFFSRAYYGGLRNHIRKTTDAELETDLKRREILQKYDCYYRYSETASFADMSDILYFFSKTYFPDRDFEHSGRYLDIFVNEVSDDKIVTI
ncbi:MAG: hypothetical protein JXR70_08315 [Spirochaetales bacterium]|nr:hypothetical protein [Spirochaetales bacterium]